MPGGSTVLEWGRASAYAEFFDIDWNPPDASSAQQAAGPVPGHAYGEVLASGDLQLQLRGGKPAASISPYHEHRFPLSAAQRRDRPAQRTSANAIAAPSRRPQRGTGRMPPNKPPIAKYHAGRRTAPRGQTKPPWKALERFDAATTEGQRRLHELLERQHYRLAWWRAAADEINWRRFFDINTLAGIARRTAARLRRHPRANFRNSMPRA